MDGESDSTVVLTGAAGFIGSHLGERLLATGARVIGFDNFDDFYDPGIKRQNAKQVAARGGSRFHMVEGDLRNERDVESLFQEVSGPFTLVHLAAMAGVRPSLENPMLYQEVNVTGTYRLLEAARRREIRHYVFGSSSSVYGSSNRLPFNEDEPSLDPVSPYAATKLIGEQIAYVYQVCHGIPATCLRFFTVYGPRQRPEMAIHQFARRIRDGAEIQLFGDGGTTRDYTYIDDIVDGVMAALRPTEEFRIYNIGGGRPITLKEMVERLEAAMSKKARITFAPMQPGDMTHTLADIGRAEKELGYRPSRPFDESLQLFVDWFMSTEKASA
jgi:UDP-glucuronate 4-epimerase